MFFVARNLPVFQWTWGFLAVFSHSSVIMGRHCREPGFQCTTGGVTFTFEGGRSWSCGACGGFVVVRPQDAAGRQHRRALNAHLVGCAPEGAELFDVPRLQPAGGVAQFLYATRVFSWATLMSACAEAEVLSPYVPVGVCGTEDDREQCCFSISDPRCRVLAEMAADVLTALSSAWPDFRIRGDRAFVLRGGSHSQYVHLDWHTTPSGVVAADSVTVFVPLEIAGRAFGLQAGCGLQQLVLAGGSVAVLSAGAYHCGLAVDGQRPVLFFYADRVGTIQGAASESEVDSTLWEDLDPRTQVLYCCRETRVSGLASLTRQLELCFEAVQAAPRSRRAPVRYLGGQ